MSRPLADNLVSLPANHYYFIFIDNNSIFAASPQDIKYLADKFLDECERRKLTKILFITGKGLHSRNGTPVIKPFLKKYLLTCLR